MNAPLPTERQVQRAILQMAGTCFPDVLIIIRRLPYRARCIEVLPEPHLPESLPAFPTALLAKEANRRGLVLGRIYRDVTGTRRFEAVT